jgi:hypothetical protein
VAGVEVWQWWAVETGSQKGRIANSAENERNHPQVRKEIGQEEQGGIQKLLLQEKNLIFHGEWL